MIHGGTPFAFPEQRFDAGRTAKDSETPRYSGPSGRPGCCVRRRARKRSINGAENAMRALRSQEKTAGTSAARKPVHASPLSSRSAGSSCLLPKPCALSPTVRKLCEKARRTRRHAWQETTAKSIVPSEQSCATRTSARFSVDGRLRRHSSYMETLKPHIY